MTCDGSQQTVQVNPRGAPPWGGGPSVGAPSSQSDSPCPAGLWKLPHIPLEDQGFRFGLKLEKVHTPSRMHPTDLNPNQRWGDSWPGRTSRCIRWLQADFSFFLSRSEMRRCSREGRESLVLREARPVSPTPPPLPVCAPSSGVRSSEEPSHLPDLQLQT